MKLYIAVLLILLSLVLNAQNSRFYKKFTDANNGSVITGSTIYIVNESTGDSLLLTENPLKAGWYSRSSVDYGDYKVYVDGLLQESGIVHGVRQIHGEKNILDNTITAVKIKNGEMIKSLNGLDDAVSIVAGTGITVASNGDDEITISSTGGGGGGGGDITAVTAGAGLSGGGSNGDITLYVGPNQITGTMIASETIASSEIADDGIETSDLEDDIITKVKMANNSVSSAEIVDGSIASADIATAAIGTTQLAGSAVTGVKIAPSAINSSHMGSNAVTTASINDLAVTVGKIGMGVTANRVLLSDGLGGATEGQIPADALASSAVTNSKLATDAVTTGKIANSTILAADIAGGEVVQSINGSTDDLTLNNSSTISITTPDAQSFEFNVINSSLNYSKFDTETQDALFQDSIRLSFNAEMISSMDDDTVNAATRKFQDGLPVFEFANGDTQSVTLVFNNPGVVLGNSCKVILNWYTDSQDPTPGNCYWRIEGRGFDDGGGTDPAFTQQTHTAAAANAGETMLTTITLSTGGNFMDGANETTQIRLSRLDNGNDTLGAKAFLLSAALRYAISNEF